MHGPDPGTAQIGFQAQVEVGRIHADEHVGAVLQQPVAQRIADACDLPVVPQHLGIAAHGELFVGPPGFEAMPRHVRPADARGRKPGPALAHAGEQQAGEQVARGFARDECGARSLRLHGQRAMPRVAAARKPLISATSSLASGADCASASMAARAASSVRPSR
jgi:hypothetical protein